MMTYYYSMLAISLALLAAYVFFWRKHFDLHITLIFVLVPITNLGHVLLAQSQSLEAALVANKVIYIGGCYLQLILMLAVFYLCRIELNRWVRIAFLALSTAVYLCVLSTGASDLFYRDTWIQGFDGVTILLKDYGPAHTALIAMVLFYFILGIAAIVYSYFKKSQVSRKNIALLLLMEIVAMVCFFGGRMASIHVELLPIACNFALVVCLIIVYRIYLYEITDTAIDSLVQTGGAGFVSFDGKLRYLGCNESAQRVFPELLTLMVDQPLRGNSFAEATILPWLQAFIQDEANREVHFERGDRSYLITVTHLFNGGSAKGYQLIIVDDTENQRYIKLLNSFNAELQDEVAAKTEHIVKMHDNLVLSMATMVESRDNSTGGHIRRTSEGVRLLVDQIRRDDPNRLPEKFCRDIVKAAPMHDLGKIAVDDAVLRKPGRFTPQEFEKMKAHAAEGARIVHEILKDTDDEDFHRIAENVAHYHHERWDGSGYPEGLKGEEIPIEARIMAIADVYDALVSKRVYKESMSFEQAHAIIMDGMGQHFDKSLQPYYLAAKPHLEDYYRSTGDCRG